LGGAAPARTLQERGVQVLIRYQIRQEEFVPNLRRVRLIFADETSGLLTQNIINRHFESFPQARRAAEWAERSALQPLSLEAQPLGTIRRLRSAFGSPFFRATSKPSGGVSPT
jgi:hypothetical protein